MDGTIEAMPILKLSCPDRPGIVAEVARAIFDGGGNILDADQHTDRVHQRFLQRIEFDLPDGGSLDSFRDDFGDLAAHLDLDWTLRRGDERVRLAILVSKQGHCLYDLLGRVAMGELAADVAVVVSNHTDQGVAAERFGVPFEHISSEADVGEALDRAEVDLVVLARYMRILAPDVIDRYRNRVINIHHSFLPAFAGARPYHQAHARGVKVIGATAHYATEQLDEGPIICQDVVSVSHRDDVASFVRRGRDLEMVVLARAVQLHLDHRVLAYENRTVVFD
ncbi:MAG TPA: formyltetrahydrofolate deformylase [Microthrixaceae bacterium]|nr:formyltetrahydrofolate deformylase [Microthrixaceae bacterium]